MTDRGTTASTRPYSAPTELREKRRGNLQGFVRFLRRYMSAWPVLVAALIGPMTKYFALVPVYKDQQNLLASITSLYGFLFAAALFYYRPVVAARPYGAPGDRQARTFTLMAYAPAVLIAVSIASIFRYVTLVQTSIGLQRQALSELVVRDQLGTEQILRLTDFINIPNGNALVAWYLAAFLAAETSLVLMALAEYLEASR
jgi:hypothetical protein